MANELTSTDLTLDDVVPATVPAYVSPARPETETTPFVTPEVPEFDLAKPEQSEALAAPYVAPTYNAPDAYVPDELATVSGQMNKLTDENSAYMQQASAAGERSAQAKGLLNSSIATTAGQSAAYSAAAPIAQADASTYATAGLAGYQGKLDAALTSMTAESQQNLAILNGKISSELAYENTVQQDYINSRNTTLQGMVSSQLSAQEAEAMLTAYEYQGLINAGLNDRQAADKMAQIKVESENAIKLDAQQQQGANDRAEIEKNLTLAELNSNDHDSISTAMTNYGLQLQQDTSAIQMDSTTSGTEKTAKLAVAQQIYEMNMASLSALYGVELDWESPTLVGTPTASSSSSSSSVNPASYLPTTTTSNTTSTGNWNLDNPYER